MEFLRVITRVYIHQLSYIHTMGQRRVNFTMCKISQILIH
jgi:hypothetical protein